MSEKKIPKISIGITSMTVILCVLCLTVFSVLTLSTALSERELSQKRAQAAEAYYQAESHAAKLANNLMSSADMNTFAEKHAIEVQFEQDKTVFCYLSPIDDKQAISVELVYSGNWEVTRWQVISMADWTPDESLTVWDGEMLFEE